MSKVPETRAVGWGHAREQWLVLITILILGLMLAVGCSGDSTAPETEEVEAKEESSRSERRDRTAEPSAAARSAQTVVSADISVKEIRVEPSEVEAGETVLVTVIVANEGGQTSVQKLDLSIDGDVDSTESISVPGEDEKTVEFRVKREEARTYTVRVGNQSGTFKVHQSKVAKRQPIIVAFTASTCSEVSKGGDAWSQNPYCATSGKDFIYTMGDDLSDVKKIAEAGTSLHYLKGPSMISFFSTASGDAGTLYLVNADGVGELSFPELEIRGLMDRSKHTVLNRSKRVVWGPDGNYFLFWSELNVGGDTRFQVVSLPKSGEPIVATHYFESINIGAYRGIPAASITPTNPKFARWTGGRRSGGRWLLVDMFSEDELAVPQETDKEPREFGQVALWSPDGSKLMYEMDGNFYVVSYTGEESKLLMPKVKSQRFVEESTVRRIQWSPDSRKIAYATQDGSVYVVNADGSADSEVGAGRPSSPLAWSTDSKKLAYLGLTSDEHMSVIVFSETDKNTEAIVHIPAFKGGTIKWAPDDRLLFVGQPGGGVFMDFGRPKTFLIDLEKKTSLNLWNSLLEQHSLEFEGDFIWLANPPKLSESVEPRKRAETRETASTPTSEPNPKPTSTSLPIREHGTLLWRFPADVTTDAIVVVDGVVYFGSRDNGEDENEEHVNAVDAATGELLWHFEANDYVYGIPAVADGVVYVGSEDNYFYALDSSTGALIWRYHQGDGQESFPVVVNGVAYVIPDYGYLYALDVSTGELLWRYETVDDFWYPPAVADGLVYVGSGSGLQALDAMTGKLLWRSEDEMWGAVAAGGIVYAVSGCIIYAMDATNGELLWQYDADDRLYNPVVANGVLYVATLGLAGSFNLEGPFYNYVYAIETSTGKLLWRYEADGRLDSIFSVADGVVYGSFQDDTHPYAGHLFAIEASTGKLLWGYELDKNETVDSAPAVADGVVYFGTDDYLYALSASTNN